MIYWFKKKEFIKNDIPSIFNVVFNSFFFPTATNGCKIHHLQCIRKFDILKQNSSIILLN